MASLKAIVKNADMPEDMQRYAVELCGSGIRTCDQEKDIASHIKREFEKRYGPTWHCVVGKSFGSLVTHESGGFIYFFLERYAVLLFKSG